MAPNLCFFLLLMGLVPAFSIILVVPEDVPAAFAAVYGFSPKIIIGNDNRLGFGFRFGNHADFQVMYELGPQANTKPLKPSRIRSATYRERIVRRRPLLEFLLRLGLFNKEASYEFRVVNDTADDEPR